MVVLVAQIGVKKMIKNFNIYTAIVYASAKPHIGNTYEVILADVIARYKRLAGYKVYFQTGTDEHGEKIEKKALENGKEPQIYVDEQALEIRKVWDSVNASYDKFIRTTDLHHKEKVAAIFEKLYNQGDIYKDYYEGLYCVPCESFWMKNQLLEDKCPDCQREVKTVREEAYFLKLSKYAEKLEKHISDNPNFIEPESRKKELVRQFIEPGLEDLCVSRTSFNWGIKVPFDQNHIIYVWIDALSNYITFSGYTAEGENQFASRWPADVHVIGKDIVRFHAIYWIIILMALDLELPKTILGHPWVLIGDDKISKSKGNVVYADELAQEYGVDKIRYYLLSQISFNNDGIFTNELLIEKTNAALANNLGNLVNRTLTMVEKYYNGVIPKREIKDIEFQEKIIKIGRQVTEDLDDYYVAKAIEKTFTIFDLANKYIEEKAPWKLIKTDKKMLDTVIYNLVEAIRHGAVLLQCFTPDTAEKIFNQLNIYNKTLESLKDFEGIDEGIKINKGEVLFQKIEC